MTSEAFGVSQVVKTTTSRVYENILPLTGVSAGVSLFLLPPIFFLPLPAGLVYLALLGVPLAGLAVFASQRILRREKWLGAALKLYARKLPGLFALGILYAALVFILYVSWWYHLRNDPGVTHASFYIALFQSYFVGMFFVSQLFTLPLLFDGQNARPWYRALVQSMQLVFRRPGYALSLFVQLVCVALLLGFTIVGFFFLFPGIGGVLLNTATKQVIQADE